MYGLSDVMVKVNLEELENTLHFIGDKVEPVYQREVRDVIKNYIKEIKKSNRVV